MSMAFLIQRRYRNQLHT